MKYKIIMIFILILILFIYYNIYRFKRIKRRMIIKKMKVDNNINYLIDESKRNLKNNPKLKTIQNKIRIVQIVKNICYIFLIIIPILFLVIYMYYKIRLKDEVLSINEMLTIYAFLAFADIMVFLGIEIYINRNYLKNKIILEEYIYNDFLRNLKHDIKWYDEYNPKNPTDLKEFWNAYKNLEKTYKKANFNKIEFDEDIYQNTLLTKTASSKKIYFEDYKMGIYKEKYIISISDFRELMIIRNIGRKHEHITNEGIFCVVKIDKNVLNNIRITNDKRNAFFAEKHYMVTTMPEEFYNDFIILAKDGYKISEKISEKSIKMIENFYYNSKIKFNISIKNNEIFFKFKTIDSMELKRNDIDDLMLKEYANIIMFVTALSEEINNNWK